MPRFHFSLYNSTGFTDDPEGRELADLDVVRREAIKAIRSIISEEALSGRIDLRGKIEILDGAGQLVLRLAFSEAVELHMDSSGSA
jgi:hypothetical protein